jgi:hypothetical protein
VEEQRKIRLGIWKSIKEEKEIYGNRDCKWFRAELMKSIFIVHNRLAALKIWRYI